MRDRTRLGIRRDTDEGVRRDTHLSVPDPGEPFDPTVTSGGEAARTPAGKIDKAEAAFERARAAAPDPRVLPQTQRITLTSGGARQTTLLSFRAYSLLIDNWTDQWVFVHAVSRFVPPQTGGVVFILRGTNKIDVEFAQPPGIVQPAAVAAQQCTMDASEQRPDLAVI